MAYAAERHIEVIPEIDMPGHFSAAMAAYPQFSCNPSGPHRVETWGGVFTDVLNVADPKAVRFVKDILDELMDIFPLEEYSSSAVTNAPPRHGRTTSSAKRCTSA